MSSSIDYEKKKQQKTHFSIKKKKSLFDFVVVWRKFSIKSYHMDYLETYKDRSKRWLADCGTVICECMDFVIFGLLDCSMQYMV